MMPSEQNPALRSTELFPREGLLTAPVLLLAEHILGSIPLWEVKRKKSGEGLREKEVVREVFFRGELRKIPLVIYASGNLGLPNSVDLELFRGFERWALAELGREKTLPTVVKISGAEILHYAGKESSGRAYAEVDRFFLRMAGTMIAAGRSKTSFDETESDRSLEETGGKVRLRTKKGIAFKIFGTVVVPGQVNGTGHLADKYEIELAPWYRESLLNGNCFVIDHALFAGMRGSLSKLLHQLLHNLFYLGKGHAEQRYSDLVGFWQLSRYSSRSRVMEQFAEAHSELTAREFLQRWEVVPIETDGKKDFVLVWDAGAAWWKTESQYAELKAKYELGEASGRVDREATVMDPFLSGLPDVVNVDAQALGDDPTAALRLLHEVMELSGRRKDPGVWEKWWKRAIKTVPHAFIWRRIGEVRERKARGEQINMGSYLSRLVKIDARRVGAAWAAESEKEGSRS